MIQLHTFYDDVNINPIILQLNFQISDIINKA